MKTDNPLPEQMEVMRARVRLVARTDAKAATFVSCAISGAGGLGKTYLVEQTLREMGVRFGLARGTIQAMVRRAYEFRAGGVLIVDDADNLVLGGGETMNFMKQLLYPAQRRTIVYDTVQARRNQRKKEPDPSIPPPSFDVRCGVIWITNLHLHDPKRMDPRVADHVQPLIDRGLKPVRLSDDPAHILDYVLWLAKEQDLFLRHRYSIAEGNDALAYFCENAPRLQSLSVRSLLEIAAHRAAEPTQWRRLLGATLLDEPRPGVPVGVQPPRLALLHAATSAPLEPPNAQIGHSGNAPVGAANPHRGEPARRAPRTETSSSETDRRSPGRDGRAKRRRHDANAEGIMAASAAT